MEATLEIKNRLGLHLRAASTLAETVKKFNATVTLGSGEQAVNARSVTNLIMLGTTLHSFPFFHLQILGPPVYK